MIIDFHTHVFPSFFREKASHLLSREPAFNILYHSPQAKAVGVKELLDNMDEAAVDRSVIFGFPWEEPEHFQRHNDYILEAVHRYPDRLTGFCCFSPRSRGGAAEAERCLGAGLSGVGELAVYDAGLSLEVVEAMEPVMSLCAEADVPLLLHANEPVGHDYPGKTDMTLRELYRFVKTYRANKIVLAHWGGGLFFYGLMKKEVRQVFKRVWFDTAASPFLYAPGVYSMAGEIIGFDKILFGSDYPLIGPQRYFDEMASENLPDLAKAQITGLNAARLLGLPA